MEHFPWWTEEQKAFAEEVRAFVKEVAPIDAKTRWTRENFPLKFIKK